MGRMFAPSIRVAVREFVKNQRNKYQTEGAEKTYDGFVTVQGAADGKQLSFLTPSRLVTGATESADENFVAILWPEQPQIAVTGHKFLLLKPDPACPFARAKLLFFFKL
jgi:hypothetical protein